MARFQSVNNQLKKEREVFVIEKERSQEEVLQLRERLRLLSGSDGTVLDGEGGELESLKRRLRAVEKEKSGLEMVYMSMKEEVEKERKEMVTLSTYLETLEEERKTYQKVSGTMCVVVSVDHVPHEHLLHPPRLLKRRGL